MLKLLLIAIALSISVLLINLSPLSLGAAVIILFFPLFLLRPRLYFSLFLVFRPVIDITSQLQVAGGINLAALATVSFVVFCGGMLLVRKNREIIKSSRFLPAFNKIFFLFLGYNLFSIMNSPQILASLSDLLRLLSILVAVNFSVVYFRQKNDLKRLFGLILSSAFIPLCLGLYQFIFKKGLPELGLNRIYGTFLHPNVFAHYLVLIFFVLLYLLNRKKQVFSQKVLLSLFISLVILELLLTFTRGAWIAVFISAAFFALIKTTFAQKLKLFFIALLIVMLALPLLQRRFADVHRGSSRQMSSWEWRLKQWDNTADALKQHPFLGNGMGMYERNFKIMAHNDYLRITYEAGVLGLVFYASILFYFLFCALNKILASSPGAGVSGYKAVFALLISLLLMSLVDNLARSTVVLLYFFVTMGYFLSINQDENIAGE